MDISISVLVAIILKYGANSNINYKIKNVMSNTQTVHSDAQLHIVPMVIW